MNSIRIAVPGRGGGTPGVTHFSFSDRLREKGLDVRTFRGEPWRRELGDILLVHGTLSWYPRVKSQLYTTPRDKLPPVVIWHHEPLPPPRASGQFWPWLDHREILKILARSPRATDPYTNYWMFRRLHQRGLPDWLYVTTAERVEFLRERGIPAELLPLGHYPDQGRDLGLERDIDVLFLGGTTLRRSLKIARLRGRGVNVTALGDFHNPEYWGEGRTRLINRAKIFLNIPRFARQFTLLRFALGACNKALLVSEPLYNSAPFVPGEHYVAADYGEMPRAIQYYLTHEEERRRIVENAYQLTLEKCLISHSIDRLAQRLRQLAEGRSIQNPDPNE
jgi:hypothetical protein